MGWLTAHYWHQSKAKFFKKDLYLINTPWWLRKFYPNCIWDFCTNEKKIFLTFDDGPHETITPFILDELKKYNAKATFFCIGKNVVQHPNIYKRILAEGHAVGNHTQHHLNAWKVSNATYEADINLASQNIISNLFRPPYGKINSHQIVALKNLTTPIHTIMWSVLSGDFDEKLSPQKCLQNVLKHTKKGSVIVFHDSDKAEERVCYTLPKVLQNFTEKGFVFEKISQI
jgi:peptidoglycan-N-acetylglucosamine deacetylase